MFGRLGMTELIIILVAVLLIFGPKRIPSLARSLGKGLREFRKASSELRAAVDDIDEDGDEERLRRRGHRRGDDQGDSPRAAAPSTRDDGPEDRREAGSQGDSEGDALDARLREKLDNMERKEGFQGKASATDSGAHDDGVAPSPDRQLDQSTTGQG